jgi:hypothetical protein
MSELNVGVCQTAVIATDEDSLFVTDRTVWLIALSCGRRCRRNVVTFRFLCFRMPLCKVQMCFNNNNDDKSFQNF